MAKTPKTIPPLPLPLALDMAVTAGICLKPEDAGMDSVENENCIMRLSEFQKLALVNASLDDCMVCFTDYNLTQNHKNVLKTIHGHTKLWCKAYAGGMVLEAMQDKANVTETAKLAFDVLDDNVGSKGASEFDGVLITFDKDDEKL